ncbi:efflux RND transporter permease subunit [Adhaeribacter radiodurans]|uniref:MMPL family transporter n=1 Tax=Adhaeribacter radiodurans TaxID=2745197 RepID=A0A7L7L657_9BACT|nr:MMPL family transporter [Adhaeribacter radiodurans]QMU28316.1 MMPL family transporter [Adhaeribacter radiodurans]
MLYKKLSYSVLLLIFLFTCLSLFFISRLRFDYNFDHFFPKHDPDLSFYLKYREKFGNDNDYLLLGLSHPKTLFDSTFLKKVDSLTTFISQLRHVERVQSPTTLSSPIIESFGIFEVPYLHVNQPERYRQDSLAIYQSEGLVGTFFSPDARSVTLLIQTSPNLTKLPSDSLLLHLKEKLQQINLPDYHIAGKAVAQSIFVDRMQYELALFMSISIAMVVIFLYFTFRTWWGVVMPLMVVLISICWAMGLMGLTGTNIDVMTMLLPTIMFVVGMSDSVHILTQYVSEVAEGKSKTKAIVTTVKDVGLATFITAITTAIGFLTLLTADIGPIRNFGVYTGIAVVVAYLLSMTMLPAMMMLMPLPPRTAPKKEAFTWPFLLRRLLLFVFKYRNRILAGTVGIILVSVYCISLIRLDTTLLDDLSDDDPVKLDFKYFEQNFSGVRPFELYLKAVPGHTLYELPVLREVEEIEKYLGSQYGLKFIFSPVTIVKNLNRAVNGGSETFFKLPDTEIQWRKLQSKLKLFRKRPELNSLVSADQTEGRLSGKMGDIGSARATVLTDQFREFIRQNTDSKLLLTHVTGSSLLLDKNNDTLTRDLMEGLLLDILFIGGIVGLMFRSFKMIVITLLPNILPIVLIGAFMGIADINLKVSTSIIFTIALGIAIDDTIHFISKLKLELLSGKPLYYAVKRTYLTTGKAVIITSCILMAGFCTLIFSSFEGTFYVGLLISLTLLFAVLSDLLLLPILVVYFFRPKTKVAGKVAQKQIQNQ